MLWPLCFAIPIALLAACFLQVLELRRALRDVGERGCQRAIRLFFSIARCYSRVCQAELFFIVFLSPPDSSQLYFIVLKLLAYAPTAGLRDVNVGSVANFQGREHKVGVPEATPLNMCILTL